MVEDGLKTFICAVICRPMTIFRLVTITETFGSYFPTTENPKAFHSVLAPSAVVCTRPCVCVDVYLDNPDTHSCSPPRPHPSWRASAEPGPAAPRLHLRQWQIKRERDTLMMRAALWMNFSHKPTETNASDGFATSARDPESSDDGVQREEKRR